MPAGVVRLARDKLSGLKDWIVIGVGLAVGVAAVGVEAGPQSQSSSRNGQVITSTTTNLALAQPTTTCSYHREHSLATIHSALTLYWGHGLSINAPLLQFAKGITIAALTFTIRCALLNSAPQSAASCSLSF